MMNNQWLSLGEYSGKYRISISTLRRRIRAGQIPFSFKMGKYFLEDRNLVDLKKEKEIVGNKSDLSISPFSLKKEIILAEEGSPLEVEQQREPYSQENKNNKKTEVFKSATKKQEGRPLSNKSLKDSSFMLPPEDLFLNKVVDAQKELYERLEKKELKIGEQQNRIAELNTLVALLEKENKELKSLLYQEKEMEEWLEIKDHL
ncbi:MAG: hypothetical protein OXM55_05460 [Bdellovibrionales bacterium]|nr:hypothetical protein [Bdellovibrionales bacterium]